MDDLEKLLAETDIAYRRDCTLAELTTFKVGGAADVVFYPESVEQCTALIRLAGQAGKKLVFLGNGSNVIGSDRGCRDWIVLSTRLTELSLGENGRICAGAGVKTVKVSSFAAQNSLSGLEFAQGIPGTVGGAVFMNAGAYGGSMDQITVKTHYLDETGRLCVLEGKEHQFGYRESFFSRNPGCMILSTELLLTPGNAEEIHGRMEDFRKRRKEKQPLEYPSAGSTFKRPQGDFAGRLIEEAGLKGYRIGDAQVSEKHAGFIINRGCATGDEIMQLIRVVQERVKERFGVDLECEVRYLGEK